MKHGRCVVERAGRCLAVTSAVQAQDNPLASYLEVLGAKTTLPVSIAESPFPPECARDVRERSGNFHHQLFGDHARYCNLYLAEVLHTALHSVQAVVMAHKGTIVYERYPRMNPLDEHSRTSPGKATVGLVIAPMEDEEKSGRDREIARILPISRASTGAASE